ncbi:hypothetical protein [Haematospirillum jordaniae]|uniref:hypothetical protein n=1 Tax=Haematospirillum jordaniae TaxID=1549855 RepID=UPI001ADE27FC|nr:hypothetical protein [Haematospirillum jordaniae]
MHEEDPKMLLLLGRIDGKLDSVLSNLARHETELTALDERVTKLERGLAWFHGVYAVASAITGFLLGAFQPFS